MQFNNIMNCSKNNIRSNSSIKSYNNSNTNNSKVLSGYEINTFYTGDTSQFDSMRGDNIVSTDIKKIKGKNGRVYYSKENKAKKINEEQKKKIEQLLGYSSSSAATKMPMNYSNTLFNARGNSYKNNKEIIMNNYNYNYNDDETNSAINNNSKTNLTSYTYMCNNNYVNPFNINTNTNINNMNKQKYLSRKKKNNNNKNKINRIH